jgi:hypothetical protein
MTALLGPTKFAYARKKYPMPVGKTTLRSFGATNVGRKRVTNEDAYLVDDEIGLYVVADGMGGHAAGEVASQEAVERSTAWSSKGCAPCRRSSAS